MSEMDVADVINPADAEKAILELSNLIARSVRIITEAETRARGARRNFDAAFARAYSAASGAVPQRKYTADIVTMGEREAADVAEIALRDAERRVRAYERQLMAWQSVNNNIRSMWNAAGIS